MPQKDLDFTNDEKFYLLLERMDISSGFMNLSQKISKNNCCILRLTLDHDELDKIHEESQSFPNFFPSSSNNENIKKKAGDSYMYIKLKSKKKDPKKPTSIIPPRATSSNKMTNKNTNNKTSSIKSKKDDPGFVIKNSSEVTKRHMSALKKLFEIYCNLGEPQNFKFLKHIKFLKFLRDCNI